MPLADRRGAVAVVVQDPRDRRRAPRPHRVVAGKAAFTLALPAWTTASIETTTKTLQRDQDPVIVPTGRLTALRDHDSARYRLYAIGHGRLGPIPFQFDARGADGELLLSEDGAESDFTFGDHDELVFMAKDTGDRASDDTSSDFPRFPSGPE